VTTEFTSTPISSAEARRAARNAGAIAAASLLSRGLQFGWQLIFTRALGPELFGVYGTVGGFLQIGAAIVMFGLSPIVIREVARRPDQAGKYLTAMMVIQTVFGLLALIVLNSAAALGGYSEIVRVFLALAAVNLIVDLFGNVCFDLLLAREQMVMTSIVSILHIIALIALAALGLLAGYSLFGVYAGVTVAGILRAAALWWLARQDGIRPVWPFDRSLARPLLVNSAPLAFTAFLSLAYQQADKLLTNRFIGNTQTGYLVAAFIIVTGVVELLNTTVLTAVYPMMSRAIGDGKNQQFGFLVEKLALFTLVICLPITLLISLFAAPLSAIFGPRYAPAAPVLSLLIWYALVMMTGNMLQQAMLAQNRQRRLLAIRATGLGINLILLAVLLPRLGVIGAPTASLTAESCVFALYLVTFRAAGWDVRRVLPGAFKLIVAGVLAASGMVLLREIHPLFGMLTGVVIYVVGVLLLGVLASDDWDLLYRLAAALPGGHIIRRYWQRDVTVNW
jgi:O-antigen/teichoic acid export membrane protein